MARCLLLLFLVTRAISFAFAQEPAPPQRVRKQLSAQEALPRPASQLVENGKVLGEEVTPHPDDLCVVCGRRIGTEGVAYRVEGRRVSVHLSVCYGKLIRNPNLYVAALQPHGAFLGAGSEGQNLSWGWFLAGLYVLVGLLFGALCAHRALHAGRNAASWFVAGLALNVIGFLLLLTRPALEAQGTSNLPEGLGKPPVTLAPQACPQCGRLNHPSADRCADCGGELKPVASSEVGKAGLRSS